MAKIAIMGAGELGWALGRILNNDETEIVFWDKSEEQLMSHCLPALSLLQVLKGSSFVFLCMSSTGVKEFLILAKNHWPKRTTVVLFSKGLDSVTGKLPWELAKDLLPSSVDLALVSGAMIAEEIATGRFGTCLVASKAKAISEKVVNLFLSTNIIALPSTDIKGVAWSGVLKNIYGLGLGIVEGLGWTINEQAVLLGQSLSEILRLIKILGGKPETFLASPVIADLVATGFDPHSFNHQVGFEFGATGTSCQFSEGRTSFPALLKRLKKEPKDFPILSNLARVVIAGEDPAEIFGRY